MDLSRLEAYDFDLPEELIAQTPLPKRDDCRLLIADPLLRKHTDYYFRDLTACLSDRDVLVVNTSRVRRSRLQAKLKYRPIEILLLERHSGGHWSALCQPGKKVKNESLLVFKPNIHLRCLGRENEIFFFRFERDGKTLTETAEEELIEHWGDVPLPPYIKQSNDLGASYQTIYSKKRGSAAAPTAGLHFTQDLLNALKRKGIEIIEVDLQIGLGTFQPVKTDNIFEHTMHSECYTISPQMAKRLNQCLRQGKKLYPVGTTSLRVLEDNWKRGRVFTAGEFTTNIFIHPPQKIQSANGLITNFHLPKSTLLMLVAAMGGHDFTLELYRYAIAQKYRFYSFGDAMFLKNKIG